MQPEPLSWELGWYFMLLLRGIPPLGQGWGKGRVRARCWGEELGGGVEMLVVNRVLRSWRASPSYTRAALPTEVSLLSLVMWGCLAFLEISLSPPESFSLLLT